MKNIKYCTAFLFLLLFSTSFFAQKSTLPKNVLETFNRKFLMSDDVVWEVKSNGDYKIKFQFEERKTIVEIDEDGTWEKTTTHIPFDELPQAVQTTVNKQKNDSKITEIKIIIKDDDETYYRVNLKDENKTIKLKINKKGKIIKSETKK